MDAPELDAPRLRLVPARACDIDVIHAMLVDADVRHYLLDDKIVPRNWAEDLLRESFRSFTTHGMGLWLIREGLSIAGFCLLRPPGEQSAPELLYALLPPYWGRGLAVEAAQSVLDYAFNSLECAEVLVEMDEPNIASARVAEKLGMAFAGTRPGPAHTLLRYVITKREWSQLERG